MVLTLNIFQLKSDTRGFWGWKVANTPEEAERLFKRTLAYWFSRPQETMPSCKPLAGSRIARRDFEVVEVERTAENIAIMDDRKWRNEDH